MTKTVEIYNYPESERAIVHFPFTPSSKLDIELSSSDYYLTDMALYRVLEALGYTVEIINCESD